jgi:FtsZ-interacting cell division protein ZipA
MQDSSTVIGIVVAVVVVVVLVAWWSARRRSSRQLQARFGPEYQRTVERLGDRGKAEDELEKRRRRVEKFEIRPLGEEERRQFASRWQAVQAQFVDNPGAAVSAAHDLVTEVMRARGYPTESLEQRQADLSVEVPAVIDDYRAASEIAERNRRGAASTEDLRGAMVHYHALFQALLVAGQAGEQPPVRQRAAR